MIHLLLSVLSIASSAPVELRLAGSWTVAVTLPNTNHPSVPIPIPKLDWIVVSEERYAQLPEFDATTRAGWRKGARLSGVIAEECTVQGALDPESLVVKADGTVFRKGIDYEADLDAGAVGRLPGGAIQADQPVLISYRYAQARIDSIVLSEGGKVELRLGRPHTVMPEVAALQRGDQRLANVFHAARDRELGPDNLFPVLEEAFPEPAGSSVAEERLPKTLRKLKSGEPIRILAWGDSVTAYQRYQTMFVDRLKQRFPNARIELITEAWGGRNTGSYLKEPPGSEHNYQGKVLGPKPDLIVSEFVNDASLDIPQVQARYTQLLADFRKIGAEWIILSPHYVRPDWMGLTRQRDIDEDPRPYVQGLRIFASENNVALADASLRYGRLWRRGIPYLTLMENNINHPNVFGHSLFADSLLSLFR